MEQVQIQQREEGDVELRRVAEQFLESKGCRGAKVLFVMITGSHSYNLARDSSDIDYFGVFLAPLPHILGLSAHLDCFTNQPNGPPPDIELYEAKKFCLLLKEGNPFILEAIFSKRLIYQTKAFVALKELRKHLLTKEAVRMYVSYVRHFMKKDFLAKNAMRRRGKRIYHTVRLLNEAQRILRREEPLVWLDNETVERQYLMDIKCERYNIEELVEKINTMIDEITRQVESEDCDLPERVDEQKLNLWLINTRKHYLDSQQTEAK